jgi:hypothetical protein
MINPAAGPFIVNTEPENQETKTPPIMAVISPIMVGKSLALAIPKLSGSAIKKTRNPADKSLTKCDLSPFIPSSGTSDFLVV